MKRGIITSLLILTLTAALRAAIGDWKIYNSYRNATSCRVVDDRVYVLSAGSLYTYGKEDNELHVYDHIDGLSDVRISFIEHSDAIDALVVVYDNANIDLLYDDGAIYNISDFKNKSLANKQINNLQVMDSMAYISTGFGIVTLNLKRREFTNTYTLGLNVNAAAIHEGYIFACTDAGLYRGKTTDNLLDKASWKQLFNFRINALAHYDGKLFSLLPDWGIYNLDIDGKLTKLHLNESNMRFSYMNADGKNLILGTNNGKVYIHDSAENYTIHTLSPDCVYLREDGNSYWACNGASGLSLLTAKNGKLTETIGNIQPNSPARNHCEYLAFSPDGKLLVAGGNLNYFDGTFYDGTAITYDGNRWLNFQEKEVKEATGLKYENVTSLAQDPYDEGHYYASSFGYGLYEFRDGEFVKHYNHKNSELKSVHTKPEIPYWERYVRVPRIRFDADGNLWMTNTGTEEIIKVLTRDGEWKTLRYNEIVKHPTMVELLFDSRGWLWVTSLQADAGLFCAKLNKTPFDTSDDECKLVTAHFKNQDGISYDINQLCALAEDRNGQMWIGTDAGLFVLPSPKKFFDGNVTFNQIKVPRNDGTGLADYLLSGAFIQAIGIDGANRKWIGTKDNGIYLISADGLETLHHFTTENSPLPSNSIASIAIDPESGEVFIGTDKGLIGYVSDATEPAGQLQESALHAYPNPVRENYTGTIAVTGFTGDCNVKITDTAGTLIYETTSNGGQITWNGCNMRGERVGAGIYYVLGYDEAGNEGAATKILIIR